MRSEKLMPAAVVLAIVLSASAARAQAPEPQQPPSTGAATESSPNPTATAPAASPSTPANPAPETQTQPSGEPKPGQGATADQHPSPVPESGATQASPNASATPGIAPEQRKSAAKKKSHKSGTPGKPRRRVVKDGGAAETEVQISEGMPGDLAQHRQASTNTLLNSTEENLKRISNRHLTPDQQNTVTQIRQFMQQSRDATQKSDVDRAHTLALKAHLLSDSLVKP